MALRDQAISLLTAANNHSDLAVKLSSLRQAKDIIFSIDPSFASELFPYLLELQYSPEVLVRKMIVEIIEEIGLKGMEHSLVLIPVLLIFLRDADHVIARQSIVSGVHLYCRGLEEMALQFHRRGKVERWLEELWIWMVKFKDAVFSIALEHGSVGTKLLALKFLETYILLFTDDGNDSEKIISEGNRWLFNISWLVGGGHPILDPGALISDANRTFGILLDFLRSPNTVPGLLTITVINGLAAIARKRPVHYGTVLSALLEFLPNVESLKGSHSASIQYSLRTAFLGFLRSTSPVILESRDKLVRTLRAMNAGDAADQVLRQVDKIMKNNDRPSLEARLSREDQLPVSGDQFRKRPLPHDNEESVNGHEVVLKRVNNGSNAELHSASVNGTRNVPLLDSDLTAAEQMIAMIGALLAEGDRGAESLEILVSNIHPDLLADIVIVNMKHLPKSPPPSTRPGNLSMTHHIGPVSSPAQDMSTNGLSTSGPINAVSSVSTVQVSSLSANMSSSMDSSAVHNLLADSKRDPRRDPRRLDPRRLSVSTGITSVPMTDDFGSMKPEFDNSISLSKHVLVPVVTSVENPPAPLILTGRTEDRSLESPLDSETDQLSLKEEFFAAPEEKSPTLEIKVPHEVLPPPCTVDEGNVESMLPDEMIGDDTSSLAESDQHLPDASYTSGPEESSQDLPQLPPYVELAEDQLGSVKKLAVERIIESYKHLPGTDSNQTRMGLLARLVAQIDSDDEIIVMLQKHIVSDYRQQKGHELVLHVLYHLYSMMILDSIGSSTYAAAVYEKFLLVVAKSLLDAFPASDKSFSKLLGEVPLLSESTLKLLDDLCYYDVFDAHGKEVRDSERVTQGLGAVWSLILTRPSNRQACLDIALKCASHSQDDIRAKAIRLVANKLYQLNFISENIEQFATNMLLSAVNQSVTDVELSLTGSTDQREGEVENQEKSTGVPQVSKTENFEIDAVRDADAQTAKRVSTISFPEAQRLISLFFALCTKKPSLLQLIFDLYGRAPKAVKQAIHRHIPILIRALGSSYSELLSIISNPPEGCENLLILVLQILTQETTPAANLIATVKHLYETKLKDATILIPILSSLSKNEVLPIFPRLVGLPIEKFQMALAHILQGSAHTGPALTPTEVLVAIHDISPEKDGLPLKKITDACSACFEQRTVFTQQVLAKALNQMVDQTPLPLLFMRTVIQAIDAFPALVDFVMEILSKLVNRQVWRMPKLWVGFLKCVAQTQPRSSHVLLQLPPPQLENFLNKYPTLRNSLAAYAGQPSMKNSLPRPTLQLLGLANESHMQQHPHVSSLHPSGTSSSAQGTNLT